MLAERLSKYIVIDDNCYLAEYTVLKFNDGTWDVPKTPNEIEDLEVFHEGIEVNSAKIKDEIINHIHEWGLYE